MVTFLVALGFFLGFGVGMAYRGYQLRNADPKRQQRQQAHKAKQRRDTEMNIGNRFAKIVRTLCPEQRRFIVQVNHYQLGDYRSGYYILVYRDGFQVLDVLVDLSKNNSLQYSTGHGDERFNFAIDKPSLQQAIREITRYLEKLSDK